MEIRRAAERGSAEFGWLHSRHTFSFGQYRDPMGTGSTIHPGEVQMMSAGTGSTHSEFNASQQELVYFLQIWIVPGKKGVAPRS